jgi:cytochrome c
LRAFVALLLAAGMLLGAGCGGETAETGREGADTSNGKQLFAQKCGSCHALQDAATISQVGPSLDAAFGRARQEGFDESTIFRVTLDQIDLAAPPMPSDLVEGQDAVDVAAYIALVAGKQPQQQTSAGATTTQPATP